MEDCKVWEGGVVMRRVVEERSEEREEWEVDL